MATRHNKKTEKREVESYRPSAWMAPFERMEDMFDDIFRRPFGFTRLPSMTRLMAGMEPAPSVDIFEEGDTIVIKTELPGMAKEDVEVNLTDDTITLSGEKRKEEKIERKDYHRLERSYGAFKRSFPLPADVQTDKAKAVFKNGVLEIRIPKTEGSKKKEKKIKIE